MALYWYNNHSSIIQVFNTWTNLQRQKSTYMAGSPISMPMLLPTLTRSFKKRLNPSWADLGTIHNHACFSSGIGIVTLTSLMFLDQDASWSTVTCKFNKITSMTVIQNISWVANCCTRTQSGTSLKINMCTVDCSGRLISIGGQKFCIHILLINLNSR